MRYGRFWYQIGKGNSREYYMFETANEREAHIKQRLSEVPHLEATIQYGDDYMKGMDLHARESSFLKSAFNAVDQIRVAGPAQEDALKQSLKDELYQAWLTNLPETSFRNRFVHRSNVEGFSQDALRNFSYSSFHMAYQQARFEYSPEMFSQMTAARIQLKDRKDESDRANMDVMRENSELTDYVRELDKRLSYILNPEDTGIVVSTLSNIGFIWYLTSFASAATNILGGLTIGLPTLIGQQIRLNPNMSYTTATLKSLGQMKDVAAQILSTGFGLERGPRIRDNMVLFPSLDRAGLSRLDQAAYNRFVADGLIDITATYDQSGLASSPTESYDGIRNRVMTALAALFHNAERFNREVIAMSAFRAAMEKRANYPDQQRAFSEAIAEAKDVTTRSMFDYSTANKPRYMQHPAARVILQFKQFPQQMTFFLTRNFVNMVKKPSETQMALMSDAEREQFLKRHALMKREATARFVGTMGMTGILAGTTGLWGFSTAASIINAVVNGFGDDEDEPFDFELEYMNWAVNTFGTNLGMFLTRGAGNAAGVDLHSRVSLDNMWFRDGRKNLDEEDAWRQFLVDLLGPTVGLTVNVARAVDLYNQGHADRALEAVAPAFIKQPLIATRYAEEGVKSLRGDPLVENVGPFDLFMQSLGFRPAEIAEIQYYNIQKKGQEQEILKKRQNLLNLYGASFMSSDAEGVQKALEKMLKFNEQHPAMAIAATSLNRSVKQRLQKSTQAQHGLILNKRMAYLLNDDYVSKLSEEDEE
jgi:predicted ester cyclase